MNIMNRLQSLFLIGTALLVSFAIFTLNDVGGASPISDGGTHFVTGLLAFDWLHAQHLSNPLQFGTDYFRHLPYIGLLLWPPLFYGLEMLVFSLFGPTTHVALMLGSVILAACSAVLGYAVWKSGRPAMVAHAVAATVLTSTLIQDVQRNLLIDGLVTLLSFGAIIQFTAYVMKPSWRGALISGLLAVLAFYAKGNAMQLGIAFPLVALVLRRPAILIDRRTLAMAAGCILITGPWLYLTAGLSAQGFLYAPGIPALAELAIVHLETVFIAMPILAPFALIGALDVIVQYFKPGRSLTPTAVFNIACFSIVGACIVFHTLIPAGSDPRYMLSAVFGCFGLAISGLETVMAWIANRLGRVPGHRTRALVLTAVLAVQAVVGIMTPLQSAPDGAGIVAAAVMKVLPASNRSILISGDPSVESSVGPALAQLDERRASKDGIVVVRGSRAFGGGAYRNRDYIPKFRDDAAYAEELHRLEVPVVVTATPKPDEVWGHIAAVQRVMEQPDSEYLKVGAVPFFGQQSITIWRRKDALLKPINFDLVTESNTLRERVSRVVH